MFLDNEEKVIEFIKKSSRPLIVIPKNSDGDTIGSALALFWVLKKTGKIPKIVCADKVSRRFSFLTGYDLIEQKAVDEFTYEISFDEGEKEIENSYFAPSENKRKFYFKSKNCGLSKDSLNFKPRSFEYDSIFVIGGANLKSLGSIYSDNPSIFSNLPVVNIDYHSSNENFGNVNLVDLNCISISEIVAKVIEMSPFLKIDNEVANLLLVGIVEKTDNLQSSRAGSEIACLAKYLFHLGARRNEIVKYLNCRGGSRFAPTIYKIIRKILFIETFWIPAFAGMTKLKLKRILITVLLVAAMGIFLFQFAIFLPQLIKKNYNLAQNISSLINFRDMDSLESQQVLEENDQALSASNEEKESAEFSKVSFNGDNNNDYNTVNNINNNAAATVARNSAGVEENKASEKKLPKKLEIPKLGISARIQDVGLDSNGKMKTPSNNTDVAWFNLGPKPGEIGSAVIVGHLDSKSGQPAVFWNLNKLKAGDDVFVIDGDNNKKRFQVVSSEKYKTETAPMEKIFGADDGVYLNLITCGGAWDKAKNNYSERIVVFTEYLK